VLFADAQAMLARIVEEKWLTARASIGFWPPIGKRRYRSVYG
jgi:5-methyltetrahydrofolate--homocysteine methyltransferase